MTKITEGPWETAMVEGGWLDVRQAGGPSGGRSVAKIGARLDVRRFAIDREDLANGIAVAALPELLAACEALIAEADAAYETGDRAKLQSIWARLNRPMRAAVDKATTCPECGQVNGEHVQDCRLEADVIDEGSEESVRMRTPRAGETVLPDCRDGIAAAETEIALAQEVAEKTGSPVWLARQGDDDHTDVDPEACPGCGCLPGDGITDGCDDEDGCGRRSAGRAGRVRRARVQARSPGAVVGALLQRGNESMNYRAIKDDHFKPETKAARETATTDVAVAREIELRVPCCHKRKVRSAPLMLHATSVVKRTCPECSGRWQVTIYPITHLCDGSKFVHRAEWLCLRGAKVRAE